MKDKVKEILSIAKGIKPSYFIDYTVMDGEIVIIKGRKFFDGSVNLIYGDIMAELRPNEEVIAKYEKDGIDEEKAALWREYWETDKD
jgi:hypothetical protein